MVSIVKNIWTRMRDRGLQNTLRYALYRLDDEFRFWRLGIRSDMQQTLAECQLFSDGNRPGHEYHVHAATPSYRVFRKLMNDHVRPRETDVFLDYGSGLGRVVFMAAMFPFRRVLGVEYSGTLNTSAEQTLSHVKGALRCKEIQLVHCDAANFELPHDVTVIYFCNPFGGSVLAEVIEKIKQSLFEAPRPLRIVYLIPGKFEELIEGCDWVTKREQVVFPVVSRERFGIYDCSVPCREPATAAAPPA